MHPTMNLLLIKCNYLKIIVYVGEKKTFWRVVDLVLSHVAAKILFNVYVIYFFVSGFRKAMVLA